MLSDDFYDCFTKLQYLNQVIAMEMIIKSIVITNRDLGMQRVSSLGYDTVKGKIKERGGLKKVADQMYESDLGDNYDSLKKALFKRYASSESIQELIKFLHIDAEELKSYAVVEKRGLQEKDMIKDLFNMLTKKEQELMIHLALLLYAEQTGELAIMEEE